VARFVLLATERSVAGRASKQLRERLTRVAQAALLQCGRARLPEVEGPMPLSQWVERGEAGQAQTLVLDPAGPPLVRLSPEKGSKFCVAVGPEGGWSDSEREEFARHGLSFCSLGLRPLRIETAAIAAVVQLSSRISTAQFDSSEGGA
jgi:16S rRNA (uracil1498-N3)-methyltransferase